MIRKSLIVFIVIFAAFNIYLKTSQKQFDAFQYQYQLNVIRAQKYIYDPEHNPSSVMVGTSLSAMLPLPDSIYNLSMPGLNIADGIEVVKAVPRLPRTVFIETNFFFSVPSKPFADLFSNSVNNQMKIWLPGMRDQNQPANILMSAFRTNSKVVERPSPENDAIPAPALFEKLLEKQKNRFKEADTLVINREMEKVAEFVQLVTASGGKVCFFEMPVENVLESLPLTTVVREKLHSRFQHLENVYFLDPPKEHNYRTMDGIHLSHTGLWDYSIYFREEMTRLFGK